ncbi:NADH:ubiquinone oxidoreductase [Candidatus Woesearchaeota archaeon]|jgi:sulfhydrogenase subunit delta|nr:NADH:ubiquinone oxidoreductase [Candidatus Woesearchaeota archaeon]
MTDNVKKITKPRKPKVGFFSFTCCQGCQFTVLFIDEILNILNKFDVKYFHLIKEKNREGKFDIVFVEGAITTKKELKKLKQIREKSKIVVAMGACACHGGIPAMRNFLENSELNKYVYNQNMLKDSIEAKGVGEHITVDYYLRGCPIIKEEFVEFVKKYLKKEKIEEFIGPVCVQCSKRGKDCFLTQKKMCLGAITHGGCGAICTKENIPCVLCRGPVDHANFTGEIKLFESWGVSYEEIKNKLTEFDNIKLDDPKK